MASITHSSRATPQPYRKGNGGSFNLRAFTPSSGISTATIAYGDVVQFDVTASTANHRIVKSSSMANVPNVVSTAFLGIAVEPDSSTITPGAVPTNTILVCLADKDTEFKWPAKVTGAVHTSTLLNTRRAIGYDSTLSMFYCDVANSTAGDAALLITDVIDPGTTNGWVIAKFLSTGVARLISGAF
jgi:hypothetical protein